MTQQKKQTAAACSVLSAFSHQGTYMPIKAHEKPCVCVQNPSKVSKAQGYMYQPHDSTPAPLLAPHSPPLSWPATYAASCQSPNPTPPTPKKATWKANKNLKVMECAQHHHQHSAAPFGNLAAVATAAAVQQQNNSISCNNNS